jgi:superfamily II DNA/RNA helicase
MVELAPNMKVRYKADPSVAGWVINISGENARVFIGGSDKLVPLAELEPAAVFSELTPDQFKVALTRRRLEHPVTDQFLSYKASKTKLLYHQFLPVKKLLESPDQRLLVADEVGTGKTIEAGLIWSELESRAANGLENVWIICPKALVGKWRDEMLQRFGFQLEVLSSEGLQQALVSLERDGVLPPRFAKSVVNLELIRLERNAERFAASTVAWDLAIFDEAHHLRNTDTLYNSLAKLICERSKAAVFLTATPLQTGLQDIVNLMATLGVDVAEDPGLLEEQMRWDMTLNDWIRLVRHQPPDWKEEARRSLANLETHGGTTRPGWVQFRKLVESADLNDRGQRTLAVNSARDLQVLSPYMTRTLRSDVDENRPTREAITTVVQFSSEEEAFYREVYRICLARALREGIPPGFVTQMPERRTASCVTAVASEIISQASEDEEEEDRSGFTREEISILEPFAKAALESPDRKLEALYEMLEHVFGELEADRVMIFSTFRGTLRYLERKLGEKGYSLELMYGPTPHRDEDCRQGEKSRDQITSEFRQGKFKVLLASEVAGEGLDFEHCYVVINYDLPWNPMRVEQRIGRCDRFGQTSDKVYIGNLASAGTIEERILSRLYERLKIFERALGDLEVILGEAIASFERDVFQRGLTEQQQEEHLERITQTIENNERNREAITQSSVISLQGRQLIDSDQDEIKEAETRFLSTEELAEFVHATIEEHLPNSMRASGAAGEFDIGRNEELRTALQGLLAAYPATHYARTEIARFRNRISQQRNTRVSFIREGDDVEFVHVRHPLLLLARHLAGTRSSDIPWCSGVVDADTVSDSTMLVWALGTLEGYTNRVELLCSAVDCSTRTVKPVSVQRAQELSRVMATPSDGQSPEDIGIEELIAQAEETLLSQFKGLADVFSTRDGLLTEKARQAVRSHAQRQISRNERQLSRENLNSNLRNMYVGWNRRLLAETEAKLAEIDRKSGIRSSLEVIGAAIIQPESHTNGTSASTVIDERDRPKAPFGRDRDKILILGDIVAPIDVEWDAESNPDRVLNP